MLGRILRRLNQVRRERTLRSGYRPQRFWELWGRTFADEDYQRRILPQHAWLARRLDTLGGKVVLEVGCGFGRNIAFLSKRCPAIRVLGVDLSVRMLGRARRELPADAGIVAGSAMRLPFGAGRFDSVFTMGLCMHVPPDALGTVLDELSRVSRGDLLLIEQVSEPAGEIERGYTFVHDYDTAIAARGWVLRNSHTVKNNETLRCLHVARDPRSVAVGPSEAAIRIPFAGEAQ